MKSPKAFWASVLFLSAVPTAMMAQMAFDGGAAISIHVSLGIASGLLALSTVDLTAPAWTRFAGVFVAGSLSIIFLSQALAENFPGGSLHHLAFGMLGGPPERLLVDAMVLWLVCVLVYDSSGRSRILGVVTLAGAIAVEVYAYVLECRGTTLDAEFALLKIVMLSPFLWLLIESGKGRRQEPGATLPSL